MQSSRSFLITILGYKLKDNTIYALGGKRYKLDPNNQATTFYPNCQVAYIQLLKIDIGKLINTKSYEKQIQFMIQTNIIKLVKKNC